jgi:hypothetical protein
MSRPLSIASAAWTVAILAAIAGVELPSDHMVLSLALFAFAVGLGLLVAITLVADGLRRRRARHQRAAAAAPSPLHRLEYLPAVTTGTRRIRWRGATSRLTPRRPGALDARQGAQQQPATAGELTGSAYPRPASSTRQPRIDEVEAGPRAP